MTGTLKNKIALVTGGSRGMGAAIAKRLAADGANVAITYSASPEKAQAVVASIKAAGGKAISIKADAAIEAEVKAAVETTAKEFGGVDILVNNAGILLNGTAEDTNLQDFDRIVAVNIKGVFVAIQAALKHMKEGGRIINIGSTMSNYSAFAGASIYTMTKSAVAGLTRGLARELGQRGITINNVQPGPVDTDMNPADGEFAAGLIPQIAIGRYGTGDEIAGMVSYLSGKDAAFVTGASLLADGGFAA